MTDESGEILRSETVHLQQEKLWYQRPATVVFLLALSLSLLLFAIGNIVDRVGAAHNAGDLRAVAIQQQKDNAELRDDNVELRAEQECRAQRSADLAVASSGVTGAQAKLVVLIIQRVTDPASYEPVLLDLQNLTDQREVAEARLASAVADCQFPS
jgi:hypothetical protein